MRLWFVLIGQIAHLQIIIFILCFLYSMVATLLKVIKSAHLEYKYGHFGNTAIVKVGNGLGIVKKPQNPILHFYHKTLGCSTFPG